MHAHLCLADGLSALIYPMRERIILWRLAGPRTNHPAARPDIAPSIHPCVNPPHPPSLAHAGAHSVCLLAVRSM